MEEAVRGGWLPQLPDYRDYQIEAGAVANLGNLPGAVSLKPYASPVRNQAAMSSCTAFAVCAAVEILRRTDADEHSTLYSPLWVYYKARELYWAPFAEFGQKVDWAHNDTGATTRDAVKVVQKLGVMPESKWPYLAKRFSEAPIPSAMAEARRWKLGPYFACNSLTDILAALTAGYPVVGAFTVYDNFFSAVRGLVPMPAGKPVYGHAVCFTGFDQEKRLLEFKNSWGEGWGDRGYYYMPFAYAEQGLLRDLWALTKEDPATRQDRPL